MELFILTAARLKGRTVAMLRMRIDQARRRYFKIFGAKPLSISEKHAHNDIGHVVRLLDRFLFGQRHVFLLALVLLIAEAVTAVLQKYPLAYLIDLLKGDRSDLSTILNLRVFVSPVVDSVALLSFAIITMAMLNSFADSFAEIALAKGGRLLGYNLRVSLYAHLQRLSLAFHDQRRTGDVLTRVTGDVTAIEEFVIASLSDIVGSLLVLVGTLVFLMYQSWQVALVAALIVPLLAVVTNFFSERIKAASKTQRAREGELASSAQEMLTSIRVIQTYSRADHEQKRFAEYSQKSMAAALEAAGLQARFSWVVKVVESLATVAVVWVGLHLMNQNALTIGTLLLFVILIENMFKPTRKLIKEWNTIGKIYASVERIGELLDRKAAVVDAADAVPAPPFKGHVEFRNVSFAYQSEEAEPSRPRLALRDVNLSIAPGEVLALVGHTGAGKSTFAQLLPRLYDPQVGEIRIDGCDLREFTLESLRSQLSMVLQETILFSGTIAANIAYGRTDATREEIIAAAIRANADEFITKLPEGYDTMIGERGANLSGGQRQRIAIARAIIRNTPILILDEPSTGLDAESTELVLLALRELMKGKTTIIISHDFKLIKHADKIAVLRDGSIVQEGTHKSLLEAGGLYANLYSKQLGSLEPPSSREKAAGANVPVKPLPNGSLSNLDLLQRLPILTTTFDADAMRAHLQSVLFENKSDLHIEKSAPGKATLLGEAGAVLRYELQVKDRATGQILRSLVNARIFADATAAEAYLRERLAPLAALMRGRPEIAPFAVPIAVIEPLRMVVSVFPIDGELPTLVAATDPARMLTTLNEMLSSYLEVTDCRVELGHYGRQHRCVLRYHVEGKTPGKHGTQRRLLYGKIAADGRGALAARVLPRLREWVVDTNAFHFNVPRSFGFCPDLQLVLLEGIRGTPTINPLLQARLSETTLSALKDGIDACAHIAAALHTSDIAEGSHRTLADDIGDLRRGLALAQSTVPELGTRLGNWMERIGESSAEFEPLDLCFSHGDFTYTQLIFDGEVSGLVDFDTVCQAEPALDLGQFLAYLRVAIRKAHNSEGSELAEQLSEQLLSTYIAASNRYSMDLERLRTRVSIYEALSLLRIALHSWQKLKGARLDHVITVLEERMACLSQLSH